MLLAEINWTTAVIIPAILSIAVGLPLSICTGLVAARMLQFSSAIRRARSESVLVAKKMKEFLAAATDDEADDLLNDFLFEIVIELREELDQPVASKILNEVAQGHLRVFQQTRKASKELKASGEVNPDKINDMLDRAFSAMRRMTEFISTIQPNYWRLSYLHSLQLPFEQMDIWRRSDCSMCCQNCKRVI